MNDEDGRAITPMVLKFAFTCPSEVKMLRKAKLEDEMNNYLQLALYRLAGCVAVVETCREKENSVVDFSWGM